jgi:hypothetical protein
MSLARATEPDLEALSAAAAGLAGAEVVCVKPVRGSGNNRLFRVEGRDGSAYALKTYMVDRHDRRDRLGAEFQGLRFVWSRGLRVVPRIVAADPVRSYALFDWVDGDPVQGATISDIDAALLFLAGLKRLAADPAAGALPLASEACLSGADAVGQIEVRVARLKQVAEHDPALAQFLDGTFATTYRRLTKAAVDGCRAAGIGFNRQIGSNLMTLSPSDFGFHNALRRADGTLVFLDFEYFGWDDPVKLVADFLLHPAMQLTETLKRRFLTGASEIFAGDAHFSARLRLLYPLFGVRWATILLNEFLPERWQRRAYAGVVARAVAKERQLAKATDLVCRLATSQGGFPYDA